MLTLLLPIPQAPPFDFEKATKRAFYRQAETQVAPNTLTGAEKREGFTLLFDGKSFAGWHGWKRTEVPKGWEVRDGAIWKDPDVVSGDILSNEKFTDFDLRFEWKVTPGANSGVFYRVDESTRGVSYSGVEYQILDDEKHADGKNPLTCASSVYAIYAREKAVARPVGQWNEGRILSNKGKVEHWLNGTKVVSYEHGSEDWKKRVSASKFSTVPTYGASPTGSLALQDHGDEVMYRTIRIRRL